MDLEWEGINFIRSFIPLLTTAISAAAFTFRRTRGCPGQRESIRFAPDILSETEVIFSGWRAPVFDKVFLDVTDPEPGRPLLDLGARTSPVTPILPDLIITNAAAWARTCLKNSGIISPACLSNGKSRGK